MANSHVPFPINVTLSSPLFQLTPVTTNTSSGWAPSCATSDCVSTATWSTGVQNSTLGFSFWGWDVAFDGSVRGAIKVQLTLDGHEVDWSPSNGKLFAIQNLDSTIQHSISLKVLNAPADSLLTINQARVNGSTNTDMAVRADEWTLPSNDRAFSYTGFVQQTSNVSLGSPTTYYSSSAGDTMSFHFNGSAFNIYGPCGPSNGMLRVTLDGKEQSMNTSKPIQADDCLLYQASGTPSLYLHQVEIANADGRQLAINRLEFLRLLQYDQNNKINAKAGIIVGVVVGVIVLIAALIVTYSMRSRKTRQKINKSFALLCS